MSVVNETGHGLAYRVVGNYSWIHLSSRSYWPDGLHMYKVHTMSLSHSKHYFSVINAITMSKPTAIEAATRSHQLKWTHITCIIKLARLTVGIAN